MAAFRDWDDKRGPGLAAHIIGQLEIRYSEQEGKGPELVHWASLRASAQAGADADATLRRIGEHRALVTDERVTPEWAADVRGLWSVLASIVTGGRELRHQPATK